MKTFNGFDSHKLLLAIAVAAGLGACSGPDTAPTANAPPAPTATPAPETAAASTSTVTVTKVDLGNAVGSDMTVAIPARTFKAGDTIYAAVSADGRASNVALKTRWKYQDGSVVNTTTQILSNTSDHSVTDFHISNPAGLAAGKYTVEVIVDGKTVNTVEFTVVP